MHGVKFLTLSVMFTTTRDILATVENGDVPQTGALQYRDDISIYHTTSLYMSWLARMIGARRQNGLEYVTSHVDGWTLIDPITQESPEFEESFNPEVSGDWSRLPCELAVKDVARLESVAPVDSFDDLNDLLGTEVDIGGYGGYPFKWILGKDSTDEDGGELIMERMVLWHQGKGWVEQSGMTFVEASFEEVDDDVASVIDRDIDRTMPVELQPRMRRVLYAFAIRNPEIGFCQGFSYIVSTLLQQEWVTDEIAFNTLTLLVENVNGGYYDRNLSGYHVDIRKLRKFLFYHERQRDYRIPLELILTDGLLTLFTRLFPTSSSVFLLDVAFAQGKVGLFAVYLAMLDLARPAVEAAIQAADPGLEDAVGGTQFKLESVRIGTMNFPLLMDRAHAYLQSHGAAIQELVNADLDIEDQYQIEVVLEDSGTRDDSDVGWQNRWDNDGADIQEEEEEGGEANKVGVVEEDSPRISPIHTDVVSEEPTYSDFPNNSRKWGLRSRKPPIVEQPRAPQFLYPKERIEVLDGGVSGGDLTEFGQGVLKAVSSAWADFSRVMRDHPSDNNPPYGDLTDM